MTSRSRVGSWGERIVFAGFVIGLIAEWRALRRRPRRSVPLRDEEMDDATDRLARTDGPADPLVPVGFEWRDTTASLAMALGLLVSARYIWGPLNGRWDTWWYRRRVANLGRGTSRVERVASWTAAMVAWDFVYYWEHRWMHEVRLLWAHHSPHHSSERYNLSTALRQPWTNIMSHWIFTPMLLAGFPPAMTARVGELNLVYQFWIHTEAIDKLPAAAERVLNTASHHRVHHGVNPHYLDRNFGGILIVWDKLFGTFEPEYRRPKYGLTHRLDSHNPVRIAFDEFIAIGHDMGRATSWRERLGYLFARPGWQPTAG